MRNLHCAYKNFRSFGDLLQQGEALSSSSSGVQPVRLGKLLIVLVWRWTQMNTDELRDFQMTRDAFWTLSPKVKLYLDSLCQDETTKLRTQSMELKRRRVDADLVLSSSDEGWKRLWDVQRFVTCKTRAGNHRHSCQASSQSRYILHVKVFTFCWSCKRKHDMPLFAAHLALVSWFKQYSTWHWHGACKGH